MTVVSMRKERNKREASLDNMAMSERLRAKSNDQKLDMEIVISILVDNKDEVDIEAFTAAIDSLNKAAIKNVAESLKYKTEG